jgi:scavenger receptor class B protein 1
VTLLACTFCDGLEAVLGVRIIFYLTVLQRNGTLSDVYTIFTGHTNMTEFGLYDRLNGRTELPQWGVSPCNSIRHASEGSLFPPRALTGSDTINVYDKDLCRSIPLRYAYLKSLVNI